MHHPYTGVHVVVTRGYHILNLFLLPVEKQAGIEIVPVFITVDPERDTVEHIAEYVKGAWVALLSSCNTTSY